MATPASSGASSRRAVVVGGGVFGCVTALTLCERGWQVIVVDPGPLPHPGASSTDVSKVIRMDYGSDAFYHELGDAAMEGWDRWNRDWPRPLYHEDGFLILSRGAMRAGEYEHDSLAVLQRRGQAPEHLDRMALARRFPRWDFTDYPEGYLNRRGGWAESGAVVQHLVVLCEAAGVDFRFAEVERLTHGGSRVSGVMTVAGERLEGDVVVVAAGAWTPRLLPWMSDVLWSTGQPVLHFHVDDPDAYRGPGFPPWAADIGNSGWYGFPALDDGRVKVAHHGPGESVHPDERGIVSADHEARTREFLRNAIPGLAAAPVVHRRTCMYCDSFDGDLWIDRDPDRDGLVVAAGGSGHAFKFAPLIGGIAADAVEGHDNAWASRFAWRERGEIRTEEARFAGS
mgnify:CR=1 FL=1